VTRDELRVEQREASIFEPCHEIDERDLARIADAAEHALAEKCAAEMHAVKPARDLSVFPDLDRMAMTEREQIAIETSDPAVDPGAAPPRAGRRATFDHGLEIGVDLHLESASADGPHQAPR
jgi:hypothetical protein